MTSMPSRIRRGGVTSPGKNSFGKSYLLLVVVRDVAAVERFCALIIAKCVMIYAVESRGGGRIFFLKTRAFSQV